jgi:hypothetical protein
MAKSDKQILDIETINIFNHPRYMKVWAQRFSKACGSDTFNVAPDTIALRYLMDKFVKDYNFHLEGLEEE